MTEQASSKRWLIVGLVGVAIALGVGLATLTLEEAPDAAGDRTSRATSASEPASLSPSLPPARSEPILPAPDYRIEESGRLSIDASSLPAGGIVTLGLDLEQPALGGSQTPLAGVIASAGDGRRLELNATPDASPHGGVRLEVEATWLQPGAYMIQIHTAEKTAFPLRRYVLEVKAANDPSRF